MADTFLNVVNENDEVIGQALRSEIHEKGLLHREVNVWLVTPDRNVIFQKRAADKDTYPNLLSSTIGGHVELDQSYLEAAIAEALEETGLVVSIEDLHMIDKLKSKTFDTITGKTNHALRMIYGYVFRGELDDLRVEQGDGAGFKAVSLDDIYHPTPILRDEIIASHLSPERQYIFRALDKMVI